VQWDSFLTDQEGGFPEVSLDGSGSSGYAGVPLTYTWGYGPNNPQNPNVTLSSTQAPDVRFRPIQEGTYTYLLTVRNGPCPASPTSSVSVTAQCNQLTALITDSAGASNNEVTLAAVTWDGTKFPLVELDGTKSEYIQLGASNNEGNLNTLSYKWVMIESPTCSCYMANETASGNVVTAIVGTSKEDNPQVEEFRNSTAVVYRLSYREKTQKTVTSTVTTLANHHYNRAHTCFKPDCPGKYRVVLTINDGCTTSAATAAVNVACRAIPEVALQPVPNVVLTGNVFRRVELTAAVTFAAGEYMSYQWSLVSKPDASSLGLESCSINNNQMPLGSFVPDRAGQYVFSFTAKDGCNPPVTRSLTINVECNSGMTIQNPLTTNASIRWRGYGSSGVTDFGNEEFSITGLASTSCQVLKTRWVLNRRDCSPPFVLSGTPPPTPAPVVSGCPPPVLDCKWSLIGEPCTDPAVNVDYLSPVMAPATGTCRTSFTPQYPGTYTLRLSVSDSCSTDSGTIKVVAKCSTTVTAVAGLDRVSIFRCSSGTRYAWDSVTLSGDGSKSAAPGSMPTVVDECPAGAAAGPVCDAEVKKQCCPSTGAACCQFQCPMCPQCPSCPACPAGGATAGGWTSFAVARDRVLAQATKPARQAKTQLGPVLMSVVIPLAALVVLSVTANVAMAHRFSMRKKTASSALFV
jgi:hypothetical protein